MKLTTVNSKKQEPKGETEEPRLRPSHGLTGSILKLAFMGRNPLEAGTNNPNQNILRTTKIVVDATNVFVVCSFP
jgi:hypothetical protein